MADLAPVASLEEEVIHAMYISMWNIKIIFSA